MNLLRLSALPYVDTAWFLSPQQKQVLPYMHHVMHSKNSRNLVTTSLDMQDYGNLSLQHNSNLTAKIADLAQTVSSARQVKVSLWLVCTFILAMEFLKISNSVLQLQVFDLYGLVEVIQQHGATYGISDVATPCLGTICTHPDSFFWWDDVSACFCCASDYGMA